MNTAHASSYDENSFWKKVTQFCKKAGKEVIEKALVLYYVLQDEVTPTWAKTTIIGALGYFIFPIDVIPDVIPVVGYTDDVAVLAAALVAVAQCITKEHRKMATEKLRDWFE